MIRVRRILLMLAVLGTIAAASAGRGKSACGQAWGPVESGVASKERDFATGLCVDGNDGCGKFSY
jgi:hypothetical protein